MANNKRDLILIAKITKKDFKREDVENMMEVGTCSPKYQQLLVYSNTLVIVFNDAIEMELAKMLLEFKSKDLNIFESIQIRRDNIDHLKFEIIEAQGSKFNWLCCPCFNKKSNKSSSLNYLL